MKGIKRNIWVFGIVSMLNDITSEAMIPLLPIFITQVLGGNAEIVGLIEGIGKATNQLSRPLFGYLSDKVRKRKVFVESGYAISIIGRGLIAISLSWPVVLIGRFLDRLGKGARTPTRDAMIAEFSIREKRGTAFGIHRALDTAGAVLGPVIALVLIPFLPSFAHLLGMELSMFNLLFILMLIPAIVALPLIVIFVKETKFSVKKARPILTKRFTRFVLVSSLFGIANFPIAFVILKASEIGLSITNTLIVYLIYNIAYMVSAFPMGRASDKFGEKKILASSFALFGLVSLDFILVKNFSELTIVLVLFGIFYAMYETSMRAFTSMLSAQENLGKSYGIIDLAIGLAGLVSGVIMGIIWVNLGSGFAFGFAGFIAILSSIAMLALV